MELTTSSRRPDIIGNRDTGFLHGAYFEGLDVAEAMSRFIKKKGSGVQLKHVEYVTNAHPYVV